MEPQEIVNSLNQMLDRATVKMAFGEPQQVGEKTLITVAKVALGFGLGGGSSPMSPKLEGQGGDAEAGSGAGGGGALRVKPLAIVEITAGETRIRPIADATSIAIAGLLLGAWNFFWLTRMLRSVFAKRRS